MAGIGAPWFRAEAITGKVIGGSTMRRRPRDTSLHPDTIKAFAGLQRLIAPELSPAEAEASVRVFLHLRGRLRRPEGGARLRDLTRAIRCVPPQAIRRALAHGQAIGSIRAVPVPSGPWGGRPTTRYELAHGAKTR